MVMSLAGLIFQAHNTLLLARLIIIWILFNHGTIICTFSLVEDIRI